MVVLEEPNDDDKRTIYNLVRNHHQYTESKRAKKLLDNFSDESGKFIKVMPLEYKRILEGSKVEEELGLTESSDG